ncbi:MAG TPA: mechanosensitive ion channel family protein [Brevundimonas sp.]|jgi:small conductance mechanosensitive channel|uniref:mechanosensitive ion channel family protein n=1 Tax=Brevundimonas sp. TaxID=1871086 RepID=UPI002DE437BD|nr:mechanosensitive ion channel family protein [Brevundimonas sp.]
MASLPELVTGAVAAGERATAVDAALVAKLTDMAGDLAVNLLVAALILGVTIVAAKWAGRVVRRAAGRIGGLRHDPTVVSFIAQVVRVAVYVIGFIAVLQRLGVQTTSIIAVLGAASLAVGLALQGTLANVAAGVVLLILRPYRVGDVIEVGGASGSVQRLDLFVTQISNANNHKIVVPNGKVLGDVIINLSGQGTRRIEIHFTVGYGSNLKQARHVIATTAAANEKVLGDPVPWAGVTALLDNAVQVTLHAWVKSDDWYQTQSDLHEEVKVALDAANIEIPFPHQVAVDYAPPARGPDPATPFPQPPEPVTPPKPRAKRGPRLPHLKKA